MNRSPSFLPHEEWKTIPWSTGTTTKGVLHHLLDLAIEIRALMSLTDELLAAQRSSEVIDEMSGEVSDDVTTKQSALWDGVADPAGRFLNWKHDLVDCTGYLVKQSQELARIFR